jgi:hypothetical protein
MLSKAGGNVSEMVVSQYCEFSVKNYTHQAAVVVDGRWMIWWKGWMVNGQFALDPASRSVVDMLPPAYPAGM